ncbi:beta-prism lectin domain-containing protein [Candidatus Arsenophonus triatominarum]|nr:beta-prism lectin domain-containing protein [Candidatus Arsenophonus triatominarum]
MLHASVTDNRNDVGKKTDFDFIKYDFEINEKNRSIIVNGSFLYKVKLIPSRNIESYKEGEFVKNDLIEWVSSKPNIATINNTGLVTGKSAGITTITAKGNHDGFEFMVTSTINVKEKKFSPIYGDQNTTLHEYIIEPPTYSLVFSGGWIVDRLGTPENTLMTGGPGGNIVNVKNMNDVKSFEVTVGDNYFGTKKSRENVEVRKVADLKLDMDINKVEYVVEGVFIGQIVITYKNGLTNKIGKNEGLINHRTETYNIPDGYILQGIKVGTFGVYIQSIQFISMPES